MKRIGWEDALGEFIAANAGRPLEWGARDCCLLAADWIFAATGVDPATAVRGTYRTAKGGRAKLRRLAGGGVLALARKVAAKQGYVEVPPRRAQRGDIVAFPGAGGMDALGVCAGGFALAIVEDHVGLVSMTSATRAWRI
jgi:hypothetical protein